jgi:hypothetical protein
MTVIEIRPLRWGWKVFEAPDVEPVFSDKNQAISYAENRACCRSGEIRAFDSSGDVEQDLVTLFLVQSLDFSRYQGSAATLYLLW